MAELHGDLFSRHACSLGAVFFVAVETIVNVANDPKRRASPVAFEPRRRVYVSLYQLLLYIVGRIYKRHIYHHK